MISRDNYINIQGWMVTDLGLKGNELLIYAIIYGFTQDGEHRFKGSLNYLASWTNSTKQGMIKAIKKLIEKNLIVKKEIWENNVKFCEYYVTKFNTTIKQSLTDGIKQSLTNNIDNNKLDNIYSTENNQDENQVANQDEKLNEYFETFYKKYPNKKAKQKAYTSFCAIFKNKKATFEQLMQGLDKYIAHINQNKIEKSYIKHPSTWLNQGCWEDEYEEQSEEDKIRAKEIEYLKELDEKDKIERAKEMEEEKQKEAEFWRNINE